MISQRIKNTHVVERVSRWYARFERPISSLSLIGGFIFDAVTLTRVDAFWENLWVIAHLVIVAVCIVLVHTIENNEGDEANPEKAHFWLVNILQFFFGGLLSTFLVFYFRSGDLTVSWPFILILGVAFWANESLKRHFVRLSFQLSLFFLSLFSCAIFLVPVIVHQIGAKIFLLSGAISLIFMFLFLVLLVRVSGEKIYKKRKALFYSIGGIFVVMNVLYFTNLIPPIPLSVKDSGMYHQIQKDASGNYIGTYEDLGWKAYFEIHDDFHLPSGADVYAYSAIFSPTDLNVGIIHEWQKYDTENRKWIDYGSVRLLVVGGREDGFRTYSVKSDLPAGIWRVNVETDRGQVIGRIRFTIVPVSTTPQLSTKAFD